MPIGRWLGPQGPWWAAGDEHSPVADEEKKRGLSPVFRVPGIPCPRYSDEHSPVADEEKKRGLSPGL